VFNTVGQVLEVIAWLLLISLAAWRTILWRRRRRLAGAGPSSAIPVEDFTGQYLDSPKHTYDATTGAWVPGERAGGEGQAGGEDQGGAESQGNAEPPGALGPSSGAEPRTAAEEQDGADSQSGGERAGDAPDQ
jgi:hypothetical protein